MRVKRQKKSFALNEGIMAKGIIVLGATFVDIKGLPVGCVYTHRQKYG